MRVNTLKAHAALAVLVRDPNLRAALQVIDRKALEQAEDALGELEAERVVEELQRLRRERGTFVELQVLQANPRTVVELIRGSVVGGLLLRRDGRPTEFLRRTLLKDKALLARGELVVQVSSASPYEGELRSLRGAPQPHG